MRRSTCPCAARGLPIGRLSPQCGATPQKRTLNKFRRTKKAENAGPRETVCGGKPAPKKGIETGGRARGKGWMKARVKAGTPPHGRERGNLSVEGQMRGRASPYGWERACVGKLIESGYGNTPRVEKGGIHSIAVHVDRKDAPRRGKDSPGRDGGSRPAPRPQALTGPLQTGMKVLGLRKLVCVCRPLQTGTKGCRMRDAGDQPKTFMSSAPTLPATVAIAASAEIPPARLFSACSRELMRISCMASRLP